MSTPVKAVRISLSVAGICFAIAWGVIGLFVVHIVPPVAPYNTIGGLIAFGSGVIAFGATIVASISGISAFVRHREDFSLSDYSLTVSAIILCAFFSYYILTLPPVY